MTTGKEIFEALVQYLLPKRDGVRDYVVCLGNQAKPLASTRGSSSIGFILTTSCSPPGSPAFVRIVSRTTPLTTAAVGRSMETLAPNAPLEPVVEREPFTPDLATRVEAGQTFEALLARAGIATSVRDAFRAAFPVRLGTTPGATNDAATAAFLRVCAGRATDGAALYVAARAGMHVPELDVTTRARLTPVLAAFTAWVDETWGAFGRTEPSAWDLTRLNSQVMTRFRSENIRHWRRHLCQRSQRHRLNWQRMNRLANRWLPPARIQHPYPEDRFHANHPR